MGNHADANVRAGHAYKSPDHTGRRRGRHGRRDRLAPDQAECLEGPQVLGIGFHETRDGLTDEEHGRGERDRREHHQAP